MRISPVVRISVGLVMLTLCILLTGDMLGLTPGRTGAVLESRKRFCETLAVQFALAAQKNDIKTISRALEVLVDRNEDVLSAGLRLTDGRVVAEAGDHRQQWVGAEERSTPTHAHVPIFRGGSQWGTVEVRFTPMAPSGMAGFLQSPLVRLLGFTALAGFLTYLLFMRRTLRHLDPSAVIPGRVKAALDVLSEGVVLVDLKERIVLANAAFSRKVERNYESLLGNDLASLGWLAPGADEEPEMLPWRRAMSRATAETGVPLGLATASQGRLTFMVNGAPILGEKGEMRGAIATFDDVSELDAKNRELRQTVTDLEASRDQVAQQKDQLQFLASRDPLTGLLNRRSFFEAATRIFEEAQAAGKPCACIMADIDFFKRINDKYGHSVGDATIQAFARIMQNAVREAELVCRYGGEEFVILLPGMDAPAAKDAAERVRFAVETCEGLTARMTGSFGVSELAFEPRDLGDLIEQADRALYASKRSGRNRVMTFDETPEHGEL